MRGYNIDDYIGKRFNHLTLIKNLNKLDKYNSKLALFKCDCGNTKELVFTQVLNGDVTSCSCENKGKKSNLTLESVRNKKIEFYKNKTQKNNKTGCTGISYINGKYRVRIQINHKSKHIGYFDNLQDAIKARKNAEEKYFNPILEKYSPGIYRKSINVLIKQSKYITHNEWNKIATKENLLSVRTIEFVSGKKLREIIKENENKAD